ncbi:hypothetical protein FY137_09795 [Agrobacterium tumefaciens]|nr:hypothetical protein FY137_09795 [Agrobacterium tumefaciens]
MSSVGFRYIIEDTEGAGARPNIRVLFFVRSKTLGHVQSFSLAEILRLLASDEIKEFIEGMFADLQELMRRAFAAGLRQAEWEFFTEWDMRVGWQICMYEVNSANPQFFHSVGELEDHLMARFPIEPSPQAFQADVRAPTIPLP